VRDVVIAGCGPTGAVLGRLLAARGLDVLVADAAAEPYPLPRAVAVDDDVLRVLLPLVPDLAVNGHQRAGFLDARGRVLLEVGLGESVLGLPELAFLHQPTLERSLRAGLGPAGAELRTASPVTLRGQDADGVDVTVGGAPERARWVVGCDGAASPLRSALGIAWRGRDDPRRWLVLDAAVDVPLVGTPYFSYLCDPRRPAVTMPLPGGHRWEWQLAPGEEPTEELVAGLLAPYDEPGAGLRVVRRATYQFAARSAQHWRRGRVLLAGDAAHTLPPFAGQGMGAGIRDAAQLAWRLAELVRADPVEPDPLAAWESERRAHLRQVTRLSWLLGALVASRHPRARDALLRGAAGTPGLGGWLRAGGPRPPSGPRLPSPRLRRLDGSVARLDALLPAEWTAFGLGTRPAGPRAVAVLAPGDRRASRDPAALEDLDGTLLALLRRRGGQLLARPDRLLA